MTPNSTVKVSDFLNTRGLILPDVDAIINRIISIIEKKNTDDSLGLKSVKYAEPDYEIYDDPPPYAFVRLARDFETTDNIIGSSENSGDLQVFHIEIGVVGYGKNIKEAQKIQLPITDKIRDVLESNRTLKGTTTSALTTTGLVTRLNIQKISRLESKVGQGITGSLISVQIHAGNTKTISVGSDAVLADIPILGITGQDGKNISEDTPGNERIITGNNPNGYQAIEIEMTSAINSKLIEIFDKDDTISLKINESSSISQTVIAYPVTIERVIQYDNINRRVLYFELV